MRDYGFFLPHSLREDVYNYKNVTNLIKVLYLQVLKLDIMQSLLGLRIRYYAKDFLLYLL